MQDLLTLIVLFLIVWFFWSGIRCKEIAIKAGQEHCAKQRVQFLDQTVERVTLRLTKDKRNNPIWFRSYYFEFATNGEHRYQGKIVMHGAHLKSIEMDPYPDPTLNALL